MHTGGKYQRGKDPAEMIEASQREYIREIA